MNFAHKNFHFLIYRDIIDRNFRAIFLHHPMGRLEHRAKPHQLRVRRQLVQNSGSNRSKNTKNLYFMPDKYTPKQTWPLVVALHGYGDNATAFHDLWKSVTDSLVGYKCVI